MLNIFKRKDNYFISNSFLEIEEVFDDPSINLGIWKREPDRDILRYIRFLHASEFNSLSQTINSNSLMEDIEDMFSTKLPEFPFIQNNAFRKDISLLTTYFMRVSKSKKAIVHLKSIDHDACRKFHVDGYESRLLCTYNGPGTQWLENKHVNRRALGTENNRIVKNWNSIREMKPFDVGFLKGENLKSPSGKGIVHRSPPIENSTKKRFLLRIDAI